MLHRKDTVTAEPDRFHYKTGSSSRKTQLMLKYMSQNENKKKKEGMGKSRSLLLLILYVCLTFRLCYKGKAVQQSSKFSASPSRRLDHQSL